MRGWEIIVDKLDGSTELHAGPQPGGRAMCLPIQVVRRTAVDDTGLGAARASTVWLDRDDCLVLAHHLLAVALDDADSIARSLARALDHDDRRAYEQDLHDEEIARHEAWLRGEE